MEVNTLHLHGTEEINKDTKTNDSDKFINMQKVLHGIVTQDAFRNELARIGYGAKNVAEGAEYVNTRLSYNYNMLNALYRGNWIARKIVDVFPSDMMKNWIKFTSALEPEQIRKIEKTIMNTKTKTKLKDGLKWARLFGGAVGLILIDGDEDLSEPLDYDNIMPDSYKGILIFDRWCGVQPDTSELVDDINDIEFGLPKYYFIDTANENANNMLQNLGKKQHKIHHSRILRFEGRDLPYWEKQQEQYWGESEIEIALEELKKRDNTSYNIASLIFLANIRVMKMSDLGQLLGSSTRQAQENLYKTLEAQNELMNNMGIYVMDKEDDFDTKEYTFSGLNDIYESFMLDVAGACEMPVTKLFGRNPAGFNATGESDLKQYYDTVEEKQVEFLKPVLDKLFPIIFMSTLGAIPDDLTWEFNPCVSVSNDELADLTQKTMSPILEAFNAGLITKACALRELKQTSEKTGMWSNISDEMIEQAEQEEQEQDISEEDKEQIQQEIGLQGSESNSNEQNTNNRPINQQQQKKPLESKTEANTDDEEELENRIIEDKRKHGWRDKLIDFWKVGK